jgi:hypothetical protein
MTQTQAEILLWLLGAHVLLLFFLSWITADGLRRIHTRLDRIPRPDRSTHA